MDRNQTLLLCIALAPLAAALLGYALRRSRDVVAYVCIAALIVSAACSIFLLGAEGETTSLQIGSIALPRTFDVDPNTFDIDQIAGQVTPELRAEFVDTIGQAIVEYPPVAAIPVQFSANRAKLLFAATTALIAVLCLLFALWERRDDARRGVLYATLTLFSSAMLLFLCADTLLLIYVAWELMGLCSFLLIGYTATPRAHRAAREAFWTTRATDFGLLLAIIILMGKFGWMTLSSIDPEFYLTSILKNFPGADLGIVVGDSAPWFTAAALLVLLAVMGKTALFPFSFWLAGAMVAPAPVSALLHAATMVAAGPFLLIQLKPLIMSSPMALGACAIAGGISLVLCGLMALSARDAKRVLAYSTISQLSIVLIGVSCLSGDAALFHLLAHAWFKAPLFLAVGCLAIAAGRRKADNVHIAEHSGDSDDADDHTLLANLAGSARRRPFALATLVLAGLALAGVAFTGGWFGKDQILLALLTRGKTEMLGQSLAASYPLAAAAWDIAAVLLLLSIPITAAYAARLVGILGWGRGYAGAATAGRGWTAPLIATGIAALLGSIGMAFAFAPFVSVFSDEKREPWRWITQSPWIGLVLALDILLVLGGIGFAWLLNVARPAGGAQAVEAGMAGPISFFDSGMRLRDFWLAFIGRGGAWLAALSGRGEAKLDEIVMNTGRDGRRLAGASSWFDIHFVDGLRYWGAEVWWVVRRWHQRLLQNGSIQHYMFVILASAVILCFVVLPAMARAINDILSRM